MFDGVVPCSAKGRAALFIALAALPIAAALALVVLFGTVFSSSLVAGGQDELDGLLWSGAVLLSVGVHLPGRWRPVLGVAALIALVAGLSLMIERERDERFVLLFFAALMLHGSIILAQTFCAHAARLLSPKWWIRRRLLERRCPRCLYDLHHLHSSRCPECGFDLGIDG